jgi:hypothetical protein
MTGVDAAVLEVGQHVGEGVVAAQLGIADLGLALLHVGSPKEVAMAPTVLPLRSSRLSKPAPAGIPMPSAPET